MSYGDLMDDLSSAWRIVDASDEPETGDKYWVHTLKTVFDEMEALGLSKPIPKPVAKNADARGRIPLRKHLLKRLSVVAGQRKISSQAVYSTADWEIVIP